MTHGPFSAEGMALDIIPQPGSVIVHFASDGTERIAWRWNDSGGWWDECLPEEDPAGIDFAAVQEASAMRTGPPECSSFCAGGEPCLLTPDGTCDATPDPESIVIHTDGSASVKKGKSGGWAFVVRFRGQVATRSGRADGTTISVMELTAIQRALRFLRPQPYPVDIYTDSQYARNALGVWGDAWERDGWITSTGKHVQHVDLIKEIRRTLRMHRSIRRVDIHWVRGHDGNPDNHLADDLAGQARRYPKTVSWSSADWKFHSEFEKKYGQHHPTKDPV